MLSFVVIVTFLMLVLAALWQKIAVNTSSMPIDTLIDSGTSRGAVYLARE
ncbi:hypothetical protein [Snodgrassella gandavensis]|nr:hypothetical protein [Snodgrassella gandavensis]